MHTLILERHAISRCDIYQDKEVTIDRYLKVCMSVCMYVRTYFPVHLSISLSIRFGIYLHCDLHHSPPPSFGHLSHTLSLSLSSSLSLSPSLFITPLFLCISLNFQRSLPRSFPTSPPPAFQTSSSSLPHPALCPCSFRALVFPIQVSIPLFQSMRGLFPSGSRVKSCGSSL